jgi:PilZ domain
VQAALAKSVYSRRQSSRFETPDGVWVCWRCAGIEDISRVSDLSVGGLFLSTPIPQAVGVKAQLDFLVQEGNIRVQAEVRHLIPSGGLGLKFTAITDQDCPNLVALIRRIQNSSGPRPAS